MRRIHSLDDIVDFFAMAVPEQTACEALPGNVINSALN
jgi:hypothetical protein